MKTTGSRVTSHKVSTFETHQISKVEAHNKISVKENNETSSSLAPGSHQSNGDAHNDITLANPASSLVANNDHQNNPHSKTKFDDS